MVTKVGRTNTMLICSDCGHPRAEKAQPHRVKLQYFATAAFLAGLALGLTSVFSKLLKSIGVSSSDRFLAAGFFTGFTALIGLTELEAGLALTDLEGFVALIFPIYETPHPNMQNNSSKIITR